MAESLWQQYLNEWQGVQGNRERLDTYVDQIDENTAARVAQINGAFPHMSAGVALAAAEANLDDDMVFALADEERQALEEDPFYRQVVSNLGAGALQTLRGLGSLAHGIWYGGVGRPVDSFLTAQRNVIRREGTLAQLNPLQMLPEWYRVQTGQTGQSFQTPLEQQVRSAVNGEPIDMRFSGETWENFYKGRDQIVTPGAYSADSVWALADQIGAGEYVEPGTRAYDFTKTFVDLGFELATDPTLLIGKSAKAAQLASRTFGTPYQAQQARAFGMVNGTRRTVLPEIEIDNYLASSQGQLTVSWLAETDDYMQIFSRLKNAEASILLKEATTEAEVAQIINRFAGRGIIRSGPSAPTRVRIGQAVENTRFARVWDQAEQLIPDMPDYTRFGKWTPKWEGIPLSNPTQAVTQFERWMQNWGASKEITSNLAEDFARATIAGDRHTAWGVWKEANEALGKELVKRGHSSEVVRSLTSIIGGPDFGTGTRQRAFWMEKIADARTADDLNIEIWDGESWYRHVSPHSAVELMDESIMMPNLLEIRRATSMFTRLQNVPGVNVNIQGANYQSLFGLGRGVDGQMKGMVWGTHDFLWNATTAAWMPLALVTRIAWPVRVTGEEQLRMAASGLESMFSHPIHYIGWAMGNKKTSRVSRFIDDTFDVQARGINDVLGDPITEAREFQEAMVRNRPRSYGGPQQPSPGSVPWDALDMTKARPDQRVTAMRIGIGKMWHDDVKQRVARSILDGDNELEEVFTWFYQSQLHRGMMRTSDKFADLISTPQGVDEWLRSQADEIRQLTGGDTELIESIANRELRGIDLFTDRLDRKALNRVLREKIEDQTANGTLHRFWVVPQDVISGADQTNLWTRTTNQLFYLLGAVPSNKLSRSPVFRQEYWREIARLMDFADYDTQLAAVAAARKANLPDDMVANIASRVSPSARVSPSQRAAIEAAEAAGDVADIAGGRPILSIEEMDMLSKEVSLRTVNTLLYQLSERGQTLGAMRLLFPFGEAWKEIGLTWSRLMATNPHALRRGQIYLDNLQQGGFIYTDPTTGEESYSSPFSGLFTNIAGLPENTRAVATSNLQGLNLFASSVIPGVGPAGNLVLGATLPDNTQAWRDMRDVVLPFGSNAYEPADLVSFDTYVETALPAWMKKAFTAIQEDGFDSRQWRSHVADSIRVLQASGEYGSSEDEIRRLSEDAESLAKKTLWFRALGQAVLPTGFRVDFQVNPNSPEAEEQMRAVLGEDATFGRTDGGFLSMAILTSLWHTLNEDNGGDSYMTTRMFLEMFGADPDNYNLYQWVSSIGTGKTEPLTGRSSDPVGRLWEEQNRDLIEKIPAVIGYFAPVGDTDELDIAAFLREVETGDRYALTGEQFIIASQKIIGTAIWRHTTRQTEGDNSDAARRFRTERQAWLDENLPYWRIDRPNVGVPSSFSQRQRIEQVELAVREPAVLDTVAGAAANEYMKMRNDALDAIERNFDDVLNRDQAVTALTRRNATANIRSILRQEGERIRAEVPEFGPLWERILLSEIGDEEVDQ